MARQLSGVILMARQILAQYQLGNVMAPDDFPGAHF